MKKAFDRPDIGLLLLRIGVGTVFLAHGVTKVGSLGGTTAFFASLGLPAAVAYMVTLLETVGATALILGILPRLASAGLATVMIGAISLVRFKAGFIGGFELETLLLFSTLALTFAGAGEYSLARLLGMRRAVPVEAQDSEQISR